MEPADKPTRKEDLSATVRVALPFLYSDRMLGGGRLGNISESAGPVGCFCSIESTSVCVAGRGHTMSVLKRTDTAARRNACTG